MSEHATFQALAERLSVAGQESRLRILFELRHHGELHVNRLAEVCGLSISAMSQHLVKLRVARFVERRPNPDKKQETLYRLSGTLDLDALVKAVGFEPVPARSPAAAPSPEGISGTPPRR